MEDQPNVEDRIAEWGITSDATLLGTNDRNRSKENPEGEHIWRVTLKCDGKEFEVHEYTMGAGHGQTPPDTADVLDFFASEAAGIENARDFEDWASEYEYNEDSRSAEKTYNAFKTYTNSLRDFLGDDRFRLIVWETERL